MKLHRFYVGDTRLEHNFWFKHEALYHQWTRVLRFQAGREVSLFNDQYEERLYKIVKIGDDAIQLELVTELVGKQPATDLYLCFSLLKKDKNDWVLQKATELGVRHFVPLLCDRTEKTGFDEERARKIVIEAAEQCGRVDIPRVREPLGPEKLIAELGETMPIFIMEQGGDSAPSHTDKAAVLIGPEGGWSDKEKQLFADKGVKCLSLSEFTLRAETAAITAAALLQ